ncbi:MAG: thiamine phosphate synthase [Rhizobiaceae bacterium]
MEHRNETAPTDRCRLIVCVPAIGEAERLLQEALAGGDIASVILLRGDLDEAAYLRHCNQLVPIAQAGEAAAIVCDDSRVMGRANADGLIIGNGSQDLHDLVARFSSHKIVGCSGLMDRHKALEVGEANPDFLFFGRPDGDIKPEAHPKNLALGEWWSRIIEIPCVVMGGSALESVVECAATGVEFVALGIAVFSHVDGPREAVRVANALLDANGPRFDQQN